jgi:hypothetical protein
MRGRLLVPLLRPDPARRELGTGRRSRVAGAAGELREPVKRLACRTALAACQLNIQEQLERGCAGRIGLLPALEAEARTLLGQREVSSCERDRREHPPRRRVPFVLLQQALGFLQTPLPNAEVRQPDQWRYAFRAIAARERSGRREQLLLRLRPTADRDQDPAVVEAAGRRHEVDPGDRATGGHQPLLGAPDVGGLLAGAQQPAVDLTDRGDAGDLAASDRGHRLVEQQHALGDPSGGHVRLAEQGRGAELEVRIPEAPCDRERGHGEPLAFRRIVRERRAVEREPPVRGRLLQPLEQALGARDPTVGGGEVAVNRAVKERQPAGQLGGLCPLSAAPVRREGALLKLDRPGVLALEVDGLAQAVEHLGALTVLVGGPLEARTRPLPVGGRKRLLTAEQQFIRGL